MMEALLAIIPGGQITAIIGAVLAALAFFWNAKRKARAEGRAEEQARTDAANRKFIEGYTSEKAAVDRLGPSAVDLELRRWSSKR